MALLKTTRVRGATLVEVVVALVVITFVLGISTMVYVNVLSSSRAHRVLNAHTVLKAVRDETSESKAYFDDKFERDGYFITRTFKPYNELPHVWHLHLEAADESGKVISSHDILLNIVDHEKEN